MKKIYENNMIIDFKEYNSLNSEKKEEIEKNINVKLFTAIFTNDIKQNIKILKQLKKKHDRINYCGIEYNENKLVGIINNANEEIIECIRAIFIKDRDERYEFIYDTICRQLDQKWIDENPCKFENNICVFERQSKNPRENGCCYAFWYKNFGTQTYGVHQCEHLHPIEHCKNPNLTCKLFVCPYLKKHSNFIIKTGKIMLVQLFFNRYQKIIIKNNFFINKKEFIEKLKKDEYRIKPLILYYVDRDFLVYKRVPKKKRDLARKYENIYRKNNRLRKQ